ncbi:unnamed protein product [Adineta ricciae]|uniref:Uncharacterized protein n=1 Tax=Adineta ricciae TaxID=249248 RepID=A0A816BD51_ADIRI|nr:unnamed protein product [Adineta ricciae]
MENVKITKVKRISPACTTSLSIKSANHGDEPSVIFDTCSQKNFERSLTPKTPEQRSAPFTRDFSAVHVKRIASAPNTPNCYAKSSKTDNESNKYRFNDINVQRVSTAMLNNTEFNGGTKSCDSESSKSDLFSRSLSPTSISDTISISTPPLTNNLSKADLLRKNDKPAKKQSKSSADDNCSLPSESEHGTVERFHREKRRKKRNISRSICRLLMCLLCLALLAGAIATALVLTLSFQKSFKWLLPLTIIDDVISLFENHFKNDQIHKPTTLTSSTTTATTATTATTTTTVTSTSSTSTTSTESSTSSTSATTTTTSDTTTTTTIACNFTNVGPLQAFDTSAPTTWTSYSATFVATSNFTSIRFSSATAQANKDWYVDNVSVIENGGAGTNLLLNGDFESGPSVGWVIYSCSSTCSASIISSTNCEGGYGSCYHNLCTPSTNIQFLEQYFTTTIGATYNVTFSVLKGGSGLGSGTAMYVNVIS